MKKQTSSSLKPKIAPKKKSHSRTTSAPTAKKVVAQKILKSKKQITKKRETKSLTNKGSKLDAESGQPSIDQPKMERYVSGDSKRHRPTNASPLNNDETKKMIMWTGVSVFMFFIVVGWAWSLKYSLVVPVNSEEKQALNVVTEELSDLFFKAGKQLDQLKTIPNEGPGLESAETKEEPEIIKLNEKELEALKQKVLDATTPETLPIQE